MPEPLIRTARTSLREFRAHDLEELAPILADPELMIYSVTGVMNRAEVQTLLDDWIEKYQTNIPAPWAIIHQNQIIGYAGLAVADKDSIQITFRIVPSHRGKGLATEIALAIKDYAFNKVTYAPQQSCGALLRWFK